MYHIYKNTIFLFFSQLFTLNFIIFVLLFFKILEKLLSNIPNSLGEDDRKQIADTTHGYVGADILCLCQQGTSCLAEYDQNYRGMKQLFVCHNFCL